MSQDRPTIYITMGDYNGIGPEVIIKSLQDPALRKNAAMVIVGHRRNFDYYCSTPVHDLIDEGEEGSPESIRFLHIEHPEIGSPRPGSMESAAGFASVSFLDEAILRCRKQRFSALVTAPISKESVALAGHPFPGHTELLAQRCETRQVAMMMLTEDFRVALVTTHQPLKSVSAHLSEDLIIQKTLTVHQALRHQFDISDPRIAVSALNPHGGEGGLFGEEERDIIAPAVAKMREMSLHVDGPLPADTLFLSHRDRRYDAYMALYHDQGMIPFKLVGFGQGVNFTAGLPIIRTSPDHGTAFDIAGRGQANPASMREAIKLAIELAAKQHR